MALRLTSSFPKDRFERTNRGNSKGDLVQHIRTEEGKDIDSRIVYGNKESESISPSDIAKAISYKKIHRTVYSIIVSKNLPKTEVKNGLLGEKDGILLVHPSIAVQVATQLRNALINVAKVTCSSFDKQSKETILYQYVMSTDFANNMEELYYVQKKLMELQNTEEKNHHLIWKKKKDHLGKLLDLCNRLSSDIRSILERDSNKGS